MWPFKRAKASPTGRPALPAPYPPGPWYRAAFSNERDFYVSQALAWTPPANVEHVLWGTLALSKIQHILTAMAANEASVVPGLIAAASQAVAFAWQTFGHDPTVDVIDLRRVEIALAYRVGHMIEPRAFSSPPIIPVAACETYLREPDSEMTAAEKEAVILLWQLWSALEKDTLAFEHARAFSSSRRHFTEEFQCFDLLPALFAEPEHPAWARYRSILLSWAGAIASAECEVGCLHRPFKYALSLGYSQYHLRRTDRDTFMSVILAQL